MGETKEIQNCDWKCCRRSAGRCEDNIEMDFREIDLHCIELA